MSCFAIRIEGTGAVFDAREGETLLAAAERGGVALPNSCRNGTCRTCICKATGPVLHVIAWPGLSAEEKQEGYVLPCVAVATGDVLLDVGG